MSDFSDAIQQSLNQERYFVIGGTTRPGKITRISGDMVLIDTPEEKGMASYVMHITSIVMLARFVPKP